MKNVEIGINKSDCKCNCCESEADTVILGIGLCNTCAAEFEKARKIINKIR